MAMSSLIFACRTGLPLKPPLFHCISKVRFSLVAAIATLDDQENVSKDRSRNLGEHKVPEWKRLNSKELGISTSMISRPTRKVLNGLKQRGYEVYLVGGCVRDFILNKIPKDFDVITSAELKQVVRTFSRCEIVGRRFPICHVHIGDTIVEVSSFSTRGRNLSYDVSCPIDCDEKDYVRWRNCLQRDFTINGLMFDPYAGILYDYMGGLEDIKRAKVRTVIPASTSFQEDSARILRAVRIAARLGFRFTRETAHFVKNLSRSILRLDRQRIMMEMNYLLAYGSAEASLRILWKFGLLDVLLPFQAAYFVQVAFKRRDKRSNMLLSLFSNLDKLLAPDRPCHDSLWIGILAFHKALSGQPRDPTVVAAYCLAVHNGGDILGGVNMARKITKPHDFSFHELSEPQDLDPPALIDEVVDLAKSVKEVLYQMTDEYHISRAMAKYPKAPYSDLAFIPLALYLTVCRILVCSREGSEKGFRSKQGRQINYEKLALGSLQELRHTFARVVCDTIYPLNLT